MSKLHETAGWLDVLTRHGSRPEEGRLSVTRQGPLSASGAAALLMDLPPEAEGWLCRASSIWILEEGQWAPVSPLGGPGSGAVDLGAGDILSAELRCSPQRSLHLRRLGGALYAWEYCEGEGEPVILFTETYAGTERGRALRYRIAWAGLGPEIPGVAALRASGAEASGAHSGAPAGQPTSPPLTALPWRPWIARFDGWRRT